MYLETVDWATFTTRIHAGSYFRKGQVIGAIAGWLAGQIMEGYGFGLIGNIVVGIVGAVIAGWLLPRLGFVLIGGIGAAIINALIGAVILLAVIGFVKKAA
jgi:uncharacterized membrane protein YeaQ/YmgE (transglycosylase-associated protein family)